VARPHDGKGGGLATTELTSGCRGGEEGAAGQATRPRGLDGVVAAVSAGGSAWRREAAGGSRRQVVLGAPWRAVSVEKAAAGEFIAQC